MKNFNFYGRMLLMSLVASVAGLFCSCSDDVEHNALRPPYALQNEFMFNKEISDIGTILWEKDQETDLYTFYITPRTGLQYVDDLLKVNDYIKLEVDNPVGEINPATNVFSVQYQDLVLANGTRAVEKDPVDYRSFVVELNEATGTLNLNVVFGIRATHQSLNITFNGNQQNGVRKAELPSLLKQWQYKKDIMTISSVVEQRFADHRELYLIAKAGVTEAPTEEADYQYLKIYMDNTVEGEVDLAQVDTLKQKVEVVLGEVSSLAAQTVEGTLLVENKEKNLSVALEAKLDGKLLRAAWNGAYLANYESANKMTLTPADKTLSPVEVNLSKVFCQEQNGYYWMFMGVNEQANSIAELKDRYLVQLILNPSELGGDYDLATADNYVLLVYDYLTYKTYDSRNVTEFSTIEGTLQTRTVPQGGKKVYLKMHADFKYGPKVDLDWFGEMTTSTETLDLTPSPKVPYLMVTNPKGDIVKVTSLTELQVGDLTGNESDAYSFYSISNSGALIKTGKVFFFLTTESDKSDRFSRRYKSPVTPKLVVSTDKLNVENFDLTTENPEQWDAGGWSGMMPLAYFDFAYTNQAWSNSGVFGSPCAERMYTTTEKGLMTVKQTGDEWYIKIEILDKYEQWGMPSGTGNTLTIEWQGKASAYKGEQL